MTGLGPRHDRKIGSLFLSHAGEDAEAAQRLGVSLRSAGLEVWLDVEKLQPGDMWQREISAALIKSDALILYVGRSGVAHWVDFELQIALDRAAKNRDFRIIPVLGPGSDPAALPEFARLFHWLDLRTPQPSPENLKSLLAAFLDVPPERVAVLPPARPPFVGLKAFDVEDAVVFFGREKETGDLLECLRRDALLLVVGDSGCGKSSLVRAGLMPCLFRGRFHDGSEWVNSWRMAITRPANDPFGELAESLPDLQPDNRFRAEQVASNRKLLAEGIDGIRDIVAGTVPAKVHTLLVVDQFEELFTSTEDAATKKRFVDCLLRAADLKGTRPIHVVMTLRADFYARCWDYPGLPARAVGNQYAVEGMRPEVLKTLVERPLSLAGAQAEAGLIQAILEEAGDQPGNLALLEHVLGELWRERRVNADVWITHEAYQRLGRLAGALRLKANDAMNHLPDDESRALARRIFVELTQLGEKSREDTKRRIATEDLLNAVGDRQRSRGVIDALASNRLITTGKEYTEVAHEILIRCWPELGEWLDAEREFAPVERRIMADAEQWKELARPSQ